MRHFITGAIILLFVLGEATRATGQIYHSFSLRAQQMGFGSQPLSHFSLTPSYTIGNSSFQAALALEIPTQEIASKEKWAGQELRPSEKVKTNRWVGKIRLKSQPETGGLGFIYAAANYYALGVNYQNTAVFEEATSKSMVNIATYGAGLFEFWEIRGSIVHLLGAEMMLLSDFKTVDLFFELKALMLHDIKLGLVMEAFQPKPQFTNFYAGVYVEYVLRW
jgi:hypothetical protein